MKSILFTFFFASFLLLNAEPIPNCNLEVIKHQHPGEGETDNKKLPIDLYYYKCVGSKTNTDALFVAELMDGTTSMMQVYIAENGEITSRCENKKTMLQAFGCGFGESLTLHVITSEEDKKLNGGNRSYAKRKIIPNPLVVSTASGLKMTCETLKLSAQTFGIRLSGLQPNEWVNFESVSNGKEQQQFSKMSDSKGNLSMTYRPGFAGANEGSFTLTATTLSDSIHLNHFWGKLAFTSPFSYPPKL